MQNESDIADEQTPLVQRNDSAKQVVTTEEYTNEGLDYAVEHAGVTLLESSFYDEAEADESDEVRWLREMRSEHKGMRWWAKPSVLYICMVLGAIGVTETLVLPSYTILSMKKLCESIAETNNEHMADGSPICDSSKVQEMLSRLTSIMFLINGGAGILLSGKLGELSDRFGRVPIFIYIGFIKMVGISIMIYVFAVEQGFSPFLFILGQCVPMLGGSAISLIAAGNSYISDIVESEERPVYISLVMSTIYGALGTGPFISSVLTGIFNGNNFVPIWCGFVLAILVTLVSALFMKEPRHELARQKSQMIHRRRRESRESVCSEDSYAPRDGKISRFSKYKLAAKYFYLQFLDLFAPLKKLWVPPTAAGSLIPRYMVILLLVIDVAVMSTAAGIPTLVLALVYLYHWDSEQLGYFVSTLGIGKGAALLLLAPLLLHYMKKRLTVLNDSLDQIDIRVIRISTVFTCISIVPLLTVKQDYSAYMFVFFQLLSSMLSPTIQSCVVKYGSKSSTGEYFGAIALVRSFSMTILSWMLLNIYSKTVKFDPLLFMYVPLTLTAVACILTAFLRIVNDPQLLRRQSETNIAVGIVKDHLIAKDTAARRESSAKSLRVPNTASAN